jgi:hypothetical protein
MVARTPTADDVLTPPCGPTVPWASAGGAREPRGAYGRALPTSRTGVGSRFALTFRVDESVGARHPTSTNRSTTRREDQRMTAKPKLAIEIVSDIV